MHKRGSGILLHISSLPSPYGIGDLGPNAYRFADFLAQTNQCFWQVLPLSPTSPRHNFSPYSSISTHAFNPLLLSPDLLYKDNYISKSDLIIYPDQNPNKVSYSDALTHKSKLIEIAFSTAQKKGPSTEFDHFCHTHKSWLDDHAIFTALSSHFQNQPWGSWPMQIQNRQTEALNDLRATLHIQIQKEKFSQFLLQNQWNTLKEYCHSLGIQLIGDLPMFVSYDSSDVWTNKSFFKLTYSNQPEFYAGAPPDRFNSQGQIWHNPVYNWQNLQNSGYSWWINRFERSFELFDILRIDHFRGLVAFWEIPAILNDATKGYWQHVPVEDFFNTVFKHFYSFPIIAEDLGTITPDVREIMARFQFPGTKVLLFGFDKNNPSHPYLPHNYNKNSMACTGTHDTNTIRGWFEHDAEKAEKDNFCRYIGETPTPENVNWKAIRLLMSSAADMVIFPLQDIIGQGSSSRMNIPGTAKGNWEYRFTFDLITEEIKNRLKEMTFTFGRA